MLEKLSSDRIDPIVPRRPRVLGGSREGVDDEKTWFEQHVGRGWPGTLSSLPSVFPWEENPGVESIGEYPGFVADADHRSDDEDARPDDADARHQNWLEGLLAWNL